MHGHLQLARGQPKADTLTVDQSLMKIERANEMK